MINRVEPFPLIGGDLISSYHCKQIDIFKLDLLARNTTKQFDIFLSHDWPTGTLFLTEPSQSMEMRIV